MAPYNSETSVMSEPSIPSSPMPAIFSDDAARHMTPPSSPPGFPWDRVDASAANARDAPAPIPAKSAFSMLGKRKALDSISDNARPPKKVAVPAKAETKKNLTQMQISLGQEVQTRCKTCGMEYVPSSAEDRKLHDKYHQQNTEGYDVGADFVSKAQDGSVFAGAKKGDSICAIDMFDSHPRKRRGQMALEVVQRELGAVDIPKDDIWDAKSGNYTEAGEPTFRAYLYVRKSKCVGFLLVERIKEAYRIVEPPSIAHTSSNASQLRYKVGKGALETLKARQKATTEQLQRPIELSKETSPAKLGISRIWTSSTHRHEKIASTLLDTAFEDYNQRVDRSNVTNTKPQKNVGGQAASKDNSEQSSSIAAVRYKLESKKLVAFSQPTELGVGLARKWFGTAYGWGVYVD